MNNYDQHVARIRAYIEKEGLVNEIGSVIEALEIENNFIYDLGEEFEELPIYQNRCYAINVLTVVQNALDINYHKAEKCDREASILLLIEKLNKLEGY